MAAPDLHALARAAHAAGLCVLPPRQDGTKQPDVAAWTCYQRQPSSLEELDCWYADGRRTGLGLVCGAVSGHLELFEFDDRAVYERFVSAAQAAGLGPLVARIAAGYAEATPGGGIHWLCVLREGGARSVALARRPRVDRAGRPRPVPLVETKGEGGYVVVAPSHGKVHPSGTPYRLLAGGFDRIATITNAERDALWSLARTFDEVPKTDARTGDPKRDDPRWLLRPGDDFNARADWGDVLEPHGWEAVRRSGEETLWRRPGGHPGGWGASTNHGDSDRLYV